MELETYYKKKRRRQFIGKAVIFGGGLLLILIIAWGFFWIPYLRVTDIKVEGYPNENGIKIAISEYLSSLDRFFLPQNNFFLLSTDNIKQILKESGFDLPEVSKQIPNTLLIHFIQMPPRLIFCPPASEAGQDKDVCFYINSVGVLGERAPKFSESPLPELILSGQGRREIGDQILPQLEAKFLDVFFEYLKNLNTTLLKIEIAENKDIKIILKENWYILTSFDLAAEEVATDLKLLLDQKIKDKRANLEYVDLRFKNKSFYKFK